MTFDTFIMVDWSGGNDRGAKPKKDAIWICVARDGVTDEPVYLRNRTEAEVRITQLLQSETDAGRRVLIGFDFAFGYPAGFASALTGSDDPFAVWDWLAARVTDLPDTNNRFDVAGQINAMFDGVGPFWGNGLQRDIPDLPRKGRARTQMPFAERREAETHAPRAFPVWQLSGAGAVGGQVIMGLPMLWRLRQRFVGKLAVWPFEPLDHQIAVVEIWPSLFTQAVADTAPAAGIKDAHQVRLMAKLCASLSSDELAMVLDATPTAEGWIFGLGHEDMLRQKAYAAFGAPPLKNDCFAMPQGAHWTPVDDAHAHLQQQLSCVCATESISVDRAAGRYLAADVLAQRAHPPAPNAAVDGYGFCGPACDGINEYSLVDGRAAAGAPYSGPVGAGQSIRILTGANLPSGVDTVVLQEDVQLDGATLRFHGPLKRGANARAAGEDMREGQSILMRGRRLTAGDIGTAVAAGVGTISVHRRLRVGIMSTGDELVPAGAVANIGQIYDANRPMLSALVAGWGCEVIDLGRAPDNRPKLRKMLDDAASGCDVIVTSGGASAGAEDHMSALLEGTGNFALWRIAMKPGRPLALGMWNETPVFGLPGNPVAAMVCALIFARPAFGVMAGGDWSLPPSYLLPAAFTKTKKAGRREYLRARVIDGSVQIFPSEGSGRVSGLSWATGLVALSDDAQTIEFGDPVRYFPFSGFDQ